MRLTGHPRMRSLLRSGRPAQRRVGVTLVLALVASLVSAAVSPVLAAAAASKRPPVPLVRMIPHTDMPVKKTAAPRTPAAGKPTATTWPAAGDADVTLPAAGSASPTAPPPPPARVGKLPVLVGNPGHTGDAAAAPSGSAAPAFHVHLADQATARKAGITGVLLSLTPTTTAQSASVAVDYSSFRDAAGGDYGTRLRLVELPPCALTTPEVAACQVQTPLPSRNDAASNTVSADVRFTPAGSVSSSPLATHPSAAAAPAGVAVAAVPGAAGSNGTFTASSLGPSGTWSVSGASGNFAWSYPVAVPPAASGAVAPKVALSYSASSVDGRTASTNNQVSWVGEGWDYSPGFVERTYRSCAEDTTLPAAQQTGDLCWAGQIVSMNLGGQSTALVLDDASHTWHPAADNGARVELLTGSSNGALGGEHWKITTADGIQYFFGRNSGPGYTNQATTNSTWTAPVYGAHAGDPCYNAAGFAASSCAQAWRWNLDYVEDPHGNVTTYYYTPETNYYGTNNGTTGVAYTRGGYLNRIDYGLRDVNGTIYAAPAPDQVLFTVSERCIPNASFTCDPSLFTTANASNWPDTPQDQQCVSGAACNNHSPTFWSTKRLTSIATQYYNGTGYTKVDSYALAQQFSSSGDPALWLSSITRTGYASGGTSIALPPVSFSGQMMDNRVAGYNNQPPMARWRITNITAETGQVISVTYSTPECTSTNVPADPANDTLRCFPVYWTFPYNTTKTLDYFHKYVTTRVQVQDPTALSPSKVTTYTYVGTPAWHFDDNEVIKPANRTYGQFRGYAQVDTRAGDTGNSLNGVPDQLTLTRTLYFRGMDGDTLPGGATRSVTVTNSLGEIVPDNNFYAGSAREVQVFNGDGGAEVSATITDPTTVATTASRGRAGLPALVAAIVANARTRGIADLAAGGTRTTSTSYAYDSLGRPVQKTDSGDGVPSVCTTTSYAENTASWIRDRKSETIASQQVCPPVGTAPSPILSDVRTFYDNQTMLGAVTGAGDATRTDTATVNNNGALSFATTATASFDGSGRPTQTVDALGRGTNLTYTPADGGCLTQVVTTNPLQQTSTVSTEAGRGTTISTVDVAGHRTDATYDELGRLMAVWLPGHSMSGGAPASATYSYLLQTAGPEAVTTKTLVALGTSTSYVTSVKLYDALGQLRQTQTDAEGGGRVAADTFYDSHGWVVRSNNRYYTSGAPSTTMISVADSAVNDRTITSHDGTGRATVATAYNGSTATWSTQTVYGGDSTTTIPPAGGVTTQTLTDARGRASEVRQYTAAPAVTGSVVSGGAYQSTGYAYTALGQQATITDPAGHGWSYGYDMLGHQISQADPDSGTATRTFDNAGQLLSSTDARGQTLAYDYDALGRKANVYSGSTSGPKLASWVYDTIQTGKLSYSTRYASEGNYLEGVGSYDGQGNPVTAIVQVPAGVAGLAGTYTTQYSWNDIGRLAVTYPASGGGLPGNDGIAIKYDTLGNPVSSMGYNAYVSAATYTAYGEAAQYTVGVSTNTAWLTFNRDPQTRRITGVNFSGQLAKPQIEDTTYAYDPAGNLIRSVDVQGPPGAPTQTQCYGYDALDRLSRAWTATDNCAAAPTTAAGSANIGGVNPYWLSWSFDPTGLRTQQVQHALPGATGGDTTTNYTYPAAGVAQPHSLTGTSTTAPAGPSWTSYGYDASGNTTTRTLASGAQTLTWDTENHLATTTTPAGATSYVYDADGKQLLRKDPTSTTLFLPGEELTYNTTTATVTGTRYYTFNGQTVAMRVGGANPTYLAGDLHGTQQIAYQSDTGVTTRRALDPYGNPLGGITQTTSTGTTTPGTWPDTHTFLDKPQEPATGLTDIGARKYDPTTGRFISVDPILNAADPQSMTGYAYANNNPTTQADPSGLWCDGCNGGLGWPEVHGYSDGIGGSSLNAADDLSWKIKSGQNEDPNKQPILGGRRLPTFKELKSGGFGYIAKPGELYQEAVYHWANGVCNNAYGMEDEGGFCSALDKAGALHHATALDLLNAILDATVLADLPALVIEDATAAGAMATAAKTGGEIANTAKEIEQATKEIEQAANGGDSIGTRISLQKQGRHVIGDRLYGGGGYFSSSGDAQQVLDAYHSGDATVLGRTRNGNVVVQYRGVTGYNNNPGAGYTDQMTNIFMIKGTKSPSVVPINPNWSGQ